MSHLPLCYWSKNLRNVPLTADSSFPEVALVSAIVAFEQSLLSLGGGQGTILETCERTKWKEGTTLPFDFENFWTFTDQQQTQWLYIQSVFDFVDILICIPTDRLAATVCDYTNEQLNRWDMNLNSKKADFPYCPTTGSAVGLVVNAASERKKQGIFRVWCFHWKMLKLGPICSLLRMKQPLVRVWSGKIEQIFLTRKWGSVHAPCHAKGVSFCKHKLVLYKCDSHLSKSPEVLPVNDTHINPTKIFLRRGIFAMNSDCTKMFQENFILEFRVLQALSVCEFTFHVCVIHLSDLHFADKI